MFSSEVQGSLAVAFHGSPVACHGSVVGWESQGLGLFTRRDTIVGKPLLVAASAQRLRISPRLGSVFWLARLLRERDSVHVLSNSPSEPDRNSVTNLASYLDLRALEQESVGEPLKPCRLAMCDRSVFGWV